MKDCFIICPIGPSGSRTRDRSDKMLRHVFEPVLAEKGYSPLRADKVPKAGVITSQVINLVMNCPLVIADLTDGNPNVFYELAIRHMVRKPFVQVVHSGQSIPFDISGVRTIEIDLSDPDSILSARQQLGLQIEEFHNGHKADSPIEVASVVHTLQNNSAAAEELIRRLDLIAGGGWASIDSLDDKLDRVIDLLETIETRLDD